MIRTNSGSPCIIMYFESYKKHTKAKKDKDRPPSPLLHWQCRATLKGI